jgi:hypothetical protein
MAITEIMLEAACQVAPDLSRSKILEILDAGVMAKNRDFPFPPLPWHITTSSSSGRGGKSAVHFVHIESLNNEDIVTWMADSADDLDVIKMRAKYILSAVESFEKQVKYCEG